MLEVLRADDELSAARAVNAMSKNKFALQTLKDFYDERQKSCG